MYYAMSRKPCTILGSYRQIYRSRMMTFVRSRNPDTPGVYVEGLPAHSFFELTESVYR